MKRFLGYLKNIPFRRKIKYGIMLSAFVIVIILACISSVIKGISPDVTAAKKWDKEGKYTQIGVYLPLGSLSDRGMYDGMIHQMEEALKTEGISPEKAGNRMVVGAYSGYGQVTLSTESHTATVDAIGVGGDFFYFHPVEMIDGAYLTEDYLMQDYVILDRETAWDLFGAINVTGMTVDIGGIPFLVAGVYDPSDAYLSKEAGLEGNQVFMFYSSLEDYGTVAGIQWLDFLVPNPVKGFGSRILNDNSPLDLKKAVVVEHSTRFDLIPLYKLVPDYMERSMSKTGIIYPYWENMVRGYENILVAFLLVETVCLVCGIVLLLHTIRPVKNIKRGINWLVARIKRRR